MRSNLFRSDHKITSLCASTLQNLILFSTLLQHFHDEIIRLAERKHFCCIELHRMKKRFIHFCVCLSVCFEDRQIPIRLICSAYNIFSSLICWTSEENEQHKKNEWYKPAHQRIHRCIMPFDFRWRKKKCNKNISFSLYSIVVDLPQFAGI